MSYKNNDDYKQYLEMFKHVDVGYLKKEYLFYTSDNTNIKQMARFLAIRDTLAENKIILVGKCN